MTISPSQNAANDGSGDGTPVDGSPDTAPSSTSPVLTSPATGMSPIASILPSPSPASAPSTSPSPSSAPVTTPTIAISSDGDGLFDGSWKTVEQYVAKNPSLKSFTMNAKDSKVFPLGNNTKAPNINQSPTRKVQVYIPEGIDKAKEYPFMIGLDANNNWVEPLASFAAKLMADKKIPMMIVIFVDNGGGDSRGNQRGLEYDKVPSDNPKFLITEVLPAVEAQFGIKLSKNGEGGGVFGGSSSGAAAFTACWQNPDRFQKVLGYSSTFTTQGGDDGSDHGAWAYQESLIAAAPTKPCRISLEVSSNDNNYFKSTTEANKLTFAALKAKNYHVRLNIAPNASHVDGGVMKASMGDNLVWLWRDYPR